MSTAPHAPVVGLKLLEAISRDGKTDIPRSSVVKGKRSGTMNTLRRLFAHSDDAAYLRSSITYQLLEVEALSILASLSSTPDVSLRDSSMPSEYAAREIR